MLLRNSKPISLKAFICIQNGNQSDLKNHYRFFSKARRLVCDFLKPLCGLDTFSKPSPTHRYIPFGFIFQGL